MKIFDMHIHARGTEPSPARLLADMASAGFYGGCVFSSPPREQRIADFPSATFEERMAELRGWCSGYEDRLFPVLWIHPFEEDIISTVRRAAEAGVAAFKMICTDYKVGDERPMAVIREIARLGLPIIFHSGILWDGNVSSENNRPMNWEALLEVEGVRFSMGHCSWPWIDECIALYGKFLNSGATGRRAEMFFDLTPGTPRIYREELLRKLYTVGYDVGSNVMMGLDSYADTWSTKWAGEWLSLDREILDSLGVSLGYRRDLYSDNLLRFLGKLSRRGEVQAPETDDSHAWSALEPSVKDTIEKWYKRLGFPKTYDAEFYRALDTVPISDAITLNSYPKDSGDGKRNLLSYLWLCESTAQRCSKLGIPEETVTDTLSDIVTWTNTWTAVKGELYLGELSWLARHLDGRLYRLGRLQFCMAGAEHEIPEYGINKGEPIIEIHIPEGERLTEESCRCSIDLAREFFARYFPAYSYKAFTCHSWLLDETLEDLLSEDSGIIRFGRMFKRVRKDESTALIRYLFTWDTNLLNLKYKHPSSSLAQKVQKAIARGKSFYEVLGVIEK